MLEGGKQTKAMPLLKTFQGVLESGPGTARPCRAVDVDLVPDHEHDGKFTIGDGHWGGGVNIGDKPEIPEGAKWIGCCKCAECVDG